jgi:hypothetical protein
MLGTDEILKNGNREPFFGPFLGSALNSILPGNLKTESSSLINKSLSELQQNTQEKQLCSNILEELKNGQIQGGLSADEYNEFSKAISEKLENIKNRNVELKAKIKEALDNLTNNKK